MLRCRFLCRAASLSLSAALVLPACDRSQSATPTPAPLPTAPLAVAGQSGSSSAAQGPAPECAPAAVPKEHPVATELPAPLEPGGKNAVQSVSGLVVSVEAAATRAGVSMLEAGGNAVDAAVATAYALAVTHPSAGNVGGGGFMLVSRRGEPTVAIDFRELAPRGLDAARFEALLQADARGPMASAVPGSVAGLNLALSRYGKLDSSRVLAPAIALARKGHRVGERLATTLRWSWPGLSQDAEARRIFGDAKGPLSVGARLLQPDLARTLERIAAAGDAGFYAGETAAAIVRAMGPTGLIQSADLSSYTAQVRGPLRFSYRGYWVETMPPASSGGLAVAQILLGLEQLDKVGAARDPLDATHLFVEVAKRAQAERRFTLMDPDAPEAVPGCELEGRLAPNALLAAFPSIDRERATPASQLHPLYAAALRELEHTTHLAVVDASGMAVSLTTTLSAGFGARYVVPGTGVVMNNSLAAFGTLGKNLPAPGRRMLSSMAPTLLFRGSELAAVLGSPGGDTIPSTVVQVLRHLVDHHLPIDAAIEAPRLHHGFVPDELRVEQQRPLPAALLDGLSARGHVVRPSPLPLGAAHGISVVNGIAYGHPDSREGGLALGPARKAP
jgi:gamma-glutamyltranspeptidase/glutathione hydrolase